MPLLPAPLGAHGETEARGPRLSTHPLWPSGFPCLWVGGSSGWPLPVRLPGQVTPLCTLAGATAPSLRGATWLKP